MLRCSCCFPSAYLDTLAQQGLDEGVEITVHHPLHVGGF
jgi:hypothetical protein